MEGVKVKQNGGDAVDYSGLRFDSHFCRRR